MIELIVRTSTPPTHPVLVFDTDEIEEHAEEDKGKHYRFERRHPKGTQRHRLIVQLAQVDTARRALVVTGTLVQPAIFVVFHED